jgi:EpsI family protein
LLASGMGYRLLAQYLDRPSDSVPLPRGTLARGLPLQIGGWQGKEVPVEESVLQAADCNDYVSRAYVRRDEPVRLWIAYGVRARDLTPHRPEVCYPGAGWTLDDTRSVELPLGGGRPLECRLYRFSRGGFGSGEMVVLNYYIVDGQYCPDVSLLRSKAARGTSGIRYMAQVQITSSANGRLTPETAGRSVQAFAADSAQAIRAVMPDAPTAGPPRAAPGAANQAAAPK